MSSGQARWVRVLWAICLLLVIAVLVSSLPGYVGQAASSGDAPAGIAAAQSAAGWLGVFFSITTAVLSIALAILLFWKGSDRPMAVFLSFYLLLYAVIMAGPMEVWLAYWMPQVRVEMGLFVQAIFLPVPSVILVLIFPDGRFNPRWTRWLVVLMALAVLPLFFMSLEEATRNNTLRAQLVNGLSLVVFVVSLGVQVHRYRRLYTPLERQQTKWVISGLAFWLVLILLQSVPYYYLLNLPPGSPLPWWEPYMSAFWLLSLSIMPISLSVAVLRYRLWDIDVIIRRTLVYAALSASLAVVFFGTVTVVQALFVAVSARSVGSLRSPVSVVISTLVIAALFNPLRHRIQSDIDRRFFRQKYDAEKVIAAFSAGLREEVDLEDLQNQIMVVVEETLQPETVSLWLRKGLNKNTETNL